MRSKTSNKTLLIGGVAALVILGGGGLYMALQKPSATPAEEAAPAKAADQAEGEAGHADEGETPEGVVELSAEQLKAAGISAKEVTPYLLADMFERTAGSSLKTNIALVLNNARLAADIAKALKA